MKNDTLKPFFLFVKKNIFAVICLLLAILVAITGTISYSAYLISGSGGGSTDVASFSVSANIDSVSALSFTNTAFWGGTADSGSGSNEGGIAMNALRSLKFSVNNFKTDDEGNKKVSDVKLKYNLTFSAPKNFVEKLAVQVFDNNDNNQQPLLPQIVISDVIDAANKAATGGVYDTSKSKDYNATSFKDMTFNVIKDGASGTITATETNKKATITLESYTKTIKQTLLMRMWDTKSLTSAETPTVSEEGGKLLPPLSVDFESDVEFYRISVSMDDFVLPAAKETTAHHIVQLAPTDTIEDNNLGGTFVTEETDGEGNKTYSPVAEIYGGEVFKMLTTTETSADTYYTDDTYTTATGAESTSSHNVMGTPKKYVQGESYENSDTTSYDVNETGGETVNSIETTYKYNDVVWNSFTITDTEPTIDNYKQGYISQTVRAENNYGTIFYIHKLKAAGTGTQTYTKTVTEREIKPGAVSQRQTKVTETETVTQVTGGQTNVWLNVKKTTTVTCIGSATVTTTTTTTTFTRSVSGTGYVYRGYYKKSEDNGGGLGYWTSTEAKYLKLAVVNIEGTPDNDKNVNYKTDSNGEKVTYTVETFNSESETYGDGAQQGSATTTGPTTTTETQWQYSVAEYYKRVLTRAYKVPDITVTSVTWKQTDDSGNTQSISYDKDSKLNMFAAAKDDAGNTITDTSGNVVNVQIYYMSQCYSKTYPFYVNVIFEQIL